MKNLKLIKIHQEFNSEKLADQFEPPDWLADEVTENRDNKNQKMVLSKTLLHLVLL